MHLETGLLTGFRQRLEEVLPIHVVVEDVFPPITPAEHMINGPGKLHSDSARHEPRAGERHPPPSSACYSLTPAPERHGRPPPVDGRGEDSDPSVHPEVVGGSPPGGARRLRRFEVAANRG